MIEQVVRIICLAGAAFYGTTILVSTATHLWAWALMQYSPI